MPVAVAAAQDEADLIRAGDRVAKAAGLVRAEEVSTAVHRPLSGATISCSPAVMSMQALFTGNGALTLLLKRSGKYRTASDGRPMRQNGA